MRCLLWRLFPLLLLWVLPYGLMAQDSNPFELKHRLVQPEKSSEKTIPEATVSRNPFDIARMREPSSKVAVLPDKPKESVTPSKTIKTSKQSQQTFLFWMVTSIIVFLALSVSLFKSTIVKSYRAFLNDNYLRLLQREQSFFFSFPFLVLYLLFLLNAGVFAFLLLRNLPVFEATAPLPLLLSAIGVVAGLFFIKHLLLAIIGAVFPIRKEISLYNFTIVIFNIIMGLMLVPFNIFLAFAQGVLSKWLIFAALFGLVIVFLFRALRGLLIARRYLALHKFHFFMYLCTVEIGPFVILLKLFLMQTGIAIQ